MEIVHAYPPNIDDIRAVFELNDRVIFTYGQTLYVPSGATIDEPLMRHEETHAKQQGDDPAGWWSKYLTDANFRVGQELQAYRRQYKAYKRMVGSPMLRRQYLTELALVLSGKIYGEAISTRTAYKKIRQTSLA